MSRADLEAKAFDHIGPARTAQKAVRLSDALEAVTTLERERDTAQNRFIHASELAAMRGCDMSELQEQVAELERENAACHGLLDEFFEHPKQPPESLQVKLSKLITDAVVILDERDALIEKRDLGEAAVREIIAENADLTRKLEQAREAIDKAATIIEPYITVDDGTMLEAALAWLRQGLAELPAPTPCRWTPNSDGFYDTSCGQAFTLSNEAGLEANGFKFCYGCGKKIEETGGTLEDEDAD